MTILLAPVISGIMTEPNILDRAKVAALLGVEPRTISVYLQRSKPGGRYASTPFPAPNGTFGGRPWWAADRADEIKRWAESRPSPTSSPVRGPRKSE